MLIRMDGRFDSSLVVLLLMRMSCINIVLSHFRGYDRWCRCPVGVFSSLTI